MTMKYLRRLILILLVMSSFSCERLFHDNDNQYLVIDSEKEKIDLLNGIYSCITKVYDRNYFVLMARSDDINPYYNYSFHYDGGSCSGNTYSGDISEITSPVYLNLYTAIITINRLISALDEVSNQKILGELYFLRGYCYFQLVRFFGTPPIVVNIDVDYFIEKPSYAEVYQFIEADLLYAIELLPESFLEARIPDETPNRGTAKALLAEVYLAMAGFPVNDKTKYAEAARLAGEVIDNAENYNYGLLDDFANLWKNAYRHNRECIFGLYFSDEQTETSNDISRNWYCPQEDYVYLSENYTRYFNLSICGGYNSGFMFFSTYPNSYRKYNSYVTGWYQEIDFDTMSGSESSIEFVPYDPLTYPCHYVSGAVSLKWFDLESMMRQGENHYASNEASLYLLRYAQTLLTYAEAKARSGTIDASCYEVVNMVRRRAHKVDISSPSIYDLPPDLSTEQFLDSVVWERAWELCVEPQGRWFDIIRLDLKDEIAANVFPGDIPFRVSDEYLNEDWYFYLIPQEDRWLNPNFSEDQDQ